jgi:hypothetical protein
LIGDEAVKLIDGHDRAKPMFLYFASLTPHAPYQAPKADVEAYKDVFADETYRTFAAMITNLDRQVGRIVAALEKKGVRENTIIFFTTDNGGATSALFATRAPLLRDREESARTRQRLQLGQLALDAFQRRFGFRNHAHSLLCPSGFPEGITTSGATSSSSFQIEVVVGAEMPSRTLSRSISTIRTMMSSPMTRA